MEENNSFVPERLYVGPAPKHLIEKSLKEQNIKQQKLRASTIEKLRAIKFKYYCSVCLIIRDENEYLEEWLRWHIAQGVEHFYIYDHGSKYPVKEFINSLGIEISKKVTVIDWLGKHKDAQPEAYNDCLDRFKQESRWIGFIDADEHVRVKTGQTLPVFLKNYEEYAGLFAVWLIYNANGHKFQSAEPLRKRFTRVSYADERASQMGKVFVQPMYMVDMVIHNGRALEGFCVVDEHKHKVYNYSLISEKPTTDLICVDHYYTKSYEEWKKKILRGSGHSKYQRKYDEFFKYNPDMEYCRENLNIKQKYEISDM